MASDQIIGELRSMASGLPGGGPEINPRCATPPWRRSSTTRTRPRGGFGGAPKFPPSALLEALLRNHERTGDPASLATVERTATAMARGGIYDQLAGGFARYSVDDAWVVPHFEKMLYDNALLLRAYAHWARRTGNPLARRVAAETARFMIEDLGADGMFVSSLDADADGREGLTYAWTPAQLTDALGADDGAWAAALFAVTEAGTFEHGSSVLQLPADADDQARFERVRALLLAARATRPQPGRDDKVVTSWNGWAITALAEAAVALGAPEFLDAATQCASTLLDLHLVDGRLRRASLGGQVGDSAAILEDHATLATGLLSLHQVTGEARWLAAATGLLDIALDHFADPDRPGRWFDTADDAEQLLVRPADPLDGATPSGASSIAEALLTAAHLVPAPRADRYATAAAESLATATPVLAKLPRSGGHWLAVAEAAVRGPIQIAVATTGFDSALLTAARQLAPGGAVVVGGPINSSELLADRDRVDGADAAYVCRGRVCDLPVTTAADLASALGCPCSVRRMSTPEANAATVKRYLELAAAGKVDDIVDLYADDGTVEDPVGGEVHIGSEAIRGFYSMIPKGDNATDLFTLRALGQEAAFHWALTIEMGGDRLRIDIISTMTFTGDGKIASMKAYWGPENMKSV